MQAADKKHHKNRSVHFVLAHSYSVYFFLFLIGVYLDIIFKFKIFTNSIMVPLGAGILILATLLILWAQNTSSHFKKDMLNKDTFRHGPYHYTRSPTHWGLFLLMLGFGIMINAFFVVVTTFISLFISKFVFIGRQERIMADKYGAPYLEYKKVVKF